VFAKLLPKQNRYASGISQDRQTQENLKRPEVSTMWKTWL